MIELAEKELELVETIEAKPQAKTTAIATTATPTDLIQYALANNADLDRLERLWVMQREWNAVEAEKAYNVAFAAFKAEAVKIIKNRTVTAGPLQGKKYAELFAVVNAITPALSANGLSAAWKTTKDEKDWLEVTCTLKHVAGHSESVSMGGPPDDGGAKNKIQARASTITYLQRYTLKAITGLSEQEDDNDGAGLKEKKEVPEELLTEARSKALEGWAALSAWIKARTPQERALLEPESASLKAAAKTADEKGKP